MDDILMTYLNVCRSTNLVCMFFLFCIKIYGFLMLQSIRTLVPKAKNYTLVWLLFCHPIKSFILSTTAQHFVSWINLTISNALINRMIKTILVMTFESVINKEIEFDYKIFIYFYIVCMVFFFFLKFVRRIYLMKILIVLYLSSYVYAKQPATVFHTK